MQLPKHQHAHVDNGAMFEDDVIFAYVPYLGDDLLDSFQFLWMISRLAFQIIDLPSKCSF